MKRIGLNVLGADGKERILIQTIAEFQENAVYHSSVQSHMTVQDVQLGRSVGMSRIRSSQVIASGLQPLREHRYRVKESIPETDGYEPAITPPETCLVTH